VTADQSTSASPKRKPQLSLGLILFWIVGNLQFVFLSCRKSGRQLAEEFRRARSKPTLAPDGPDRSPGSMGKRDAINVE
jgi:hypothetical protein